MSAIVRQLCAYALAAGLSWWFFLRVPEEASVPAATAPVPAPIAVAVTPRVQAPGPDAVLAPVLDPELDPEPQPEEPEAPPPPERGAPEGVEEGERIATAPEEMAAEPADSLEPEPPVEGRSPEPEAGTGPVRASAETLLADADLLEEARRELEGELRRGFDTVLVAAPEEQLGIARFFGEELVLLPRASLDPEDERPLWFRLDAQGAVESRRERPPLEGYRQYRDLFDYEYSSLPEPLRRLRRSVLQRTEVFLFAALIPVSEWALILGRRQEALVQSGREASDVRRFVLHYVRHPEGRFDLAVEEILFADGSRFRPTLVN